MKTKAENQAMLNALLKTADARQNREPLIEPALITLVDTDLRPLNESLNPRPKPLPWTTAISEGLRLPQQAQGKPELPEYSPLPWHIAAEADGDFAILAKGKDTGRSTSAGEITCHDHVAIVEGGANAKLIVASVNHAEALAEALSLLMRTANDTLRHPTIESQLECLNDCVQQCNATLKAYRAAQ